MPELAARGARIALLDRDERVHAVAREVDGRAWVVDVADEAALARCADAVEAELGPVEILVNSAGVIQVPLPLDRLSMTSWDEVVRVDQRGTYAAAVVFGTRMAGRRRGEHPHIASVAGMRSMPLHAYAPAKAAVIAMTECLAAEWGPARCGSSPRRRAIPGCPRLQAAIDKGERDVAALEATRRWSMPGRTGRDRPRRGLPGEFRRLPAITGREYSSRLRLAGRRVVARVWRSGPPAA